MTRREKNLRKRFRSKGESHETLVKVDDFLDNALDRKFWKKTVSNVYKACNRYVTRVDENHFLLRLKKIYHRAIYNKARENSKKGIEECKNGNVPLEIDLTIHEGEVVLYHSDKYSSKLGQEASIAEKVELDRAITFKEALNFVDGAVPIVIDLKAYSVFNRTLEKKVIEDLEGYKGEYTIQSFNPLSLKYFAKKRPDIVRGQLGNSLSAVKQHKRFREIVLLVVNFCLFYNGHPDYIVYDLDETVKALAKINNIVGLPIIGYTARSNEDMEEYKEMFNSFFVEGQF